MIPNKRRHTLPLLARRVIERAKRAAYTAANAHEHQPMRKGLACEAVVDFSDRLFYVAYLGDGSDECATDAIDACERVLNDGLLSLGYAFRGEYDEKKDLWEILVTGNGQPHKTGKARK